MASFDDVIKVTIDIASNNATAALGDVKGKMAEAEGGFDKLKSAGGGVFDTLKSAAPLALAGAGAAVGAFALKSINDFKDLAISVGQFSDATGTTVQDASRLIEVADDLGVGTDAVQGAMQRLNREADQGKLAKFGITAEDANGRLLQTVNYLGGIKDEGQRAQAQFELFGKSGAALEPLIAHAKELDGRLKDVAGNKIISPEEVQNANDLRDAMDNVTDAIDNLALGLGKKLAPALASAAKAAVGDDGNGGLLGAFFATTDFLGGVNQAIANPFQALTDKLLEGDPALKKQIADWPLLGAAISDSSEKTQTAAEKVKGLSDNEKILAGHYQDRTGVTRDATAATEEEKAATEDATKATDAAKKATDDAKKASEDHAKGLRDEAKAFNELVATMHDSADATLAYQAAGDEMATFLEDLPQKIKDAKGNQQDLNAINRDGIDKAKGLADAYVGQAAKSAEATGATYAAQQQQEDWNGMMLQSVGNLSGPMQEALVNYIAQVNGIPPEKLSEIKAAIAAGDLATAEALLNDASRSRDVAMKADADTTQAEIDLEYAARTRQVYLQAITVGGDFVGPLGGLDHGATGGPRSGLVWVGEEGPELVNLPVGSYVNTAPKSKKMAAMMAAMAPHFAGGGTVTAGTGAARVGATGGDTLHDLFGPGGAYFMTSDDPLRKLFGGGTDFARWIIDSAPYRGWTLDDMFGPGTDFYRTGQDALEILFGGGADFANLLVHDPNNIRPVPDVVFPSPSTMTPVAPTVAHGSDPWSMNPSTMDSPLPWVSPSGASDLSSMAPSTGGSSGGMGVPSGAGGPVNITINMPPGSDGADVVNKLTAWSKQNGPLPRVVTGV